MSHSSPRDSAEDGKRQRQRPNLNTQKKKGCRERKCSKWKGGKCRCGRD